MQNHEDGLVVNSVYNINLCGICQIPNKLELKSISATTDNEETYLDLLKSIFNDISWAEDIRLSLACQSCINKIESVADFKKICLESSRRGIGDYEYMKLKIEELEIVDTLYYTSKNGKAKIEDKLTSHPKAPFLEHDFDNTRQSTEFYEIPKHKLRGRPKIHQIKSVTSNGLELINHTNERRSRLAGGKFHSCDICQTQCKTLAEYDRHMNKHNGRRNYVCSICGRTYITKTDLHQHAFRHSTEATHACKLCPNKKFKSAKDLRTHTTIVHTNKEDYKYVCSQCGKKCSQLCTLKVHIVRAHTKVRNFKCDMCDKTFCDKGDLTKHYPTHSNIRAYKCDLCPAEYKLKPVLLVHKAKQHGIGNYKFHVTEKLDCSYCGKKIAKNKLPRHIRTHTGVKPFCCRLCDMKFICNSYIKGHLKSKHDIDVEASDYDTKSYYNVADERPLEDTKASFKEKITTIF